MADLERARAMYVEHEASHFYLWKADRLDEYRTLGATDADEARWREEMTPGMLDQLDGPGAWRAQAFLVGEGRSEHVAVVAATRPTGPWWERCAYEEGLLDILDGIVRPSRPALPPEVAPGDLADALERIIDVGATLGRQARSERNRARVDHLVRRADARLAAARRSPTGRWDPRAADEAMRPST